MLKYIFFLHSRYACSELFFLSAMISIMSLARSFLPYIASFSVSGKQKTIFWNIFILKRNGAPVTSAISSTMKTYRKNTSVEIIHIFLKLYIFFKGFGKGLMPFPCVYLIFFHFFSFLFYKFYHILYEMLLNFSRLKSTRFPGTIQLLLDIEYLNTN